MASLSDHLIAEAIDTAPLNRGLNGVDWLARPGNIPVTFENGNVALFDDEGEGVYQVHFLFACRGAKAIDNAREAFKIMFTEHGANLIFGLVPDFRRDVKLLARWAGGKSGGVRWAPEGPGLPDVKFELFVLSKFQWKVANQ
jgi:hypothetical protein